MKYACKEITHILLIAYQSYRTDSILRLTVWLLNIKNNKLIFPTILYVFYIIILAAGMYHHEMWRDELQAWSIARDSTNFLDLYKNLRYEGTPGLWHLCLFFLSRVTRNPVVMQIFHFLIASVTTALILYKTKLPSILKAFYIVGYFSLFEYGVISRNYALGLLFAVLVAIEMAKNSQNYIKMAVFAVFMGFTSIHGLLLSVCVIPYILIDNTKTFKLQGFIDTLRKSLLPIAIIVLGIALSYLSALPPKDGTPNELFRTYKDKKLFMETFSSMWYSYVPIPIERVNFWNSNLVTNLSTSFQLSVALLFITATLLIKRPKLLVFYLSSTFLILFFSYTKFSGTLRHWGHLYVAFLMVLTAFYGKNETTNTRLNTAHKWVFTLFVSSVFITQAFAGVKAMRLEIMYPFSAGKETAKFISENYPERFIIADDQVYVNDVGMYLDEPTYSTLLEEKSSFAVWKQNIKYGREDTGRTIKKGLELREKMPETKILLVTSYFIDESTWPVNLIHTSGPFITTKRPVNVYEIKN